MVSGLAHISVVLIVETFILSMVIAKYRLLQSEVRFENMMRRIESRYGKREK